MNHYKIIIPFYNVENWIKLCVRSVIAQKYTDFQCILINDCSTDNSKVVVEDLIKNDSRFVLLNNENKKYALKNIIDAINYSNPKDNDIIVTLDGDDWLHKETVLDTLNDVYNNTKCLITYGNYAEFPSARTMSHMQRYSEDIINNNSYREDMWKATHLRTFKFILWNNIEQKDFLDEDGSYLDVTWDMAFMFPMLEMAGNRQEFIKDILYVYNRMNPINDDKIKRDRQLYYERIIRNRKKYNKLELK
jgi:glycosyltransferase involved in cell wall biosynthesis